MLKDVLNLIKRCLVERDKQLHAVVGAGVAVAVVLLGYGPAMAFISVAALGLVKEVYDFLSKKFINAEHNADVVDAVATILGGSLGMAGLELSKLVIAQL